MTRPIQPCADEAVITPSIERREALIGIRDQIKAINDEKDFAMANYLIKAEQAIELALTRVEWLESLK